MGLFFYNLFLLFFNAGVRIAALFSDKAKKWVKGRENIFEKLEKAIPKKEKILWMHCASLGEFEQGRPLLEKLSAQYPGLKILLTFFSPSGYETRKDYQGADFVFYLPIDGPANAKRFLQIVKPSLVIFVKYEFWYYYLKTIHEQQTPLLLISAIFRKNSVFFKWYGGLQRKMLSFFHHLFVQTEVSRQLLGSIGLAANCSVAGDTRIDRVIEIAESSKDIQAIEEFTGNQKTIIAGSTWPADEELLQQTLQTINEPSLKLIIAPHEIGKEHILELQKLFPEAVLYSELTGGNGQWTIGNGQLAIRNALTTTSSLPLAPSTLIIDNIGMLSRLYKYAYITYVGGGFGKGIHNTLEAAVYGKPVLFGPAYHKFNEAVALIQDGGAIKVANIEDCTKYIQELLHDKEKYAVCCKSAGDYVYANRGATEKILRFIQEKRLLTN